METCKRYLRNECRLQMCKLDHNSPKDFCVSCWQRSRSSLPLLILRTLLFLLSLAIMLTSMSIWTTSLNVSFGMWFIYMTHWGVVLLVLTTGFSASISAIAYFKRSIIIDGTYGLPWYVKTYWILYNTSVPVAFLITIFYYGILFAITDEVEYAPNPWMDVAVHGINSVLMALELCCSGHPSRLLHFYQPLLLALIYLLFGVIYHFTDGVDPWGNPWVYPVVNWSNPGTTAAVVVVTALVLVLLHLIVVALAVGRDALAARYRREESDVPLRDIERDNMEEFTRDNNKQFSLE